MSMVSCAAAAPVKPSRSAPGSGKPGAAKKATHTNAAASNLSQYLIGISPSKSPPRREGTRNIISLNWPWYAPFAAKHWRYRTKTKMNGG